MMATKVHSYAEVLVARQLLCQNSKVVQGCVDESSVSASVRVANKLGREGEYCMVCQTTKQLSNHGLLFSIFYNPVPPMKRREPFKKILYGKGGYGAECGDPLERMSELRKVYLPPKLSWVKGYIEDQTGLIKACDLLLFHDCIPVERDVSDGKKEWDLEGQRMLFRKIMDAGPKTMCIYLQNSKKPEKVAELLRSLDLECEIVDKVDYAGDFDTRAERDKFVGKVIIAKLRV